MRVKVNNRITKVNPKRFAWGVPEQTVENWYVTIAAKHAEKGYPLFVDWQEGDPFTPQQAEFVIDYWLYDLVEPSVRRLAQRFQEIRECLKATGGKLDTRAIDSSIWVYQVPERPGIWRSYRSSGKTVSVGVAPFNGISGGEKYEDTYQFRTRELTIRNRPESIDYIIEASGCDKETAESIHTQGKVRGWLKCHDKSLGLWSSSHAMPTANELTIAREKYGKPQTEVQIKLRQLLGDLPPDVHHDHRLGEDNPEADSVIKWMLADFRKIQIIEWFQGRTETKKNQEMSLADFANVLYDNRNKMSRKKSTWPTVTLPDARVQGVDWVGEVKPQKEFRNEAEEREEIMNMPTIDIDFGQHETVPPQPEKVETEPQPQPEPVVEEPDWESWESDVPAEPQPLASIDEAEAFAKVNSGEWTDNKFGEWIRAHT
jgi:hypothetical protein